MQYPFIDRLAPCCAAGLDESHRALSWQLLLFHLPPQKSDWEVVLEGNRETYRALCAQFIKAPLLSRLPCEDSDSDEERTPSPAAPSSPPSSGDAGAASAAAEAATAPAEQAAAAPSDPLSVPPPHAIQMPPFSPEASPDQLLIDEIVKDVTRTHQTYEFFRREAAQSLANILFLYAKLNPGISYVQGMNELVAPLLWVCAKHTGGAAPPPEQVEADTFGLFSRLMSEVKEMYMRSMDQEGEGIHGVLGTFGTLMARHEPVVTAHLLGFGIEPAFYAFRWLTALLSREFDLADTIRIWDSLLADPRRYTFLQFICVAMVRLQRAQLLSMDFSDCVSLLQNYPPVPVDSVLACAERILQTENAQLRGARTKSPHAIPAGVMDVMKRMTGAVTRTIRRGTDGESLASPAGSGGGDSSPEVSTPHPPSMPHSTDSIFNWLTQTAGWGSALQSPPSGQAFLGGTAPVRVPRRAGDAPPSAAAAGGVFTSASYGCHSGIEGDQEMQAPRARGGSEASATRLGAPPPPVGTASPSSPGAASLHTPVTSALPALSIPRAGKHALHMPVALPSVPATQATADVRATAASSSLFSVQACSSAGGGKGLFDDPTPGNTPTTHSNGAAPKSRLSSLLGGGSDEETRAADGGGGGLFGASDAPASKQGGLFDD